MNLTLRRTVSTPDGTWLASATLYTSNVEDIRAPQLERCLPSTACTSPFCAGLPLGWQTELKRLQLCDRIFKFNDNDFLFEKYTLTSIAGHLNQTLTVVPERIHVFKVFETLVARFFQIQGPFVIFSSTFRAHFREFR
jgi:hypothetical protein